MSTLPAYPVQSAPSLSAAGFRKFCDLAYSSCGINLQQGKEQLVAARLLKVMRALNIATFDDYYRFVKSDRSGKALEAMIDFLTTNHTGFFRETAHFDFLKSTILPLVERRGEIPIWSAACSTGEEPYSLAFAVTDALGERALPRLKILATDISTRVLSRARRGVFEAERVSNINRDYLRRYFLRGEGHAIGWYMVKKAIRERIQFRRLNLTGDFEAKQKFPLILCRNVMIYFDAATQTKLVNALTACLEPGGYLFIGHSESLGSITHNLSFVAPAIYKHPGTLKGSS